MMQRAIERALNDADESGASATWRGVCQALSGPLRVAVTARRIEAADRLARQLTAQGIHCAASSLSDDRDLGTEETVLSSHVLVWPTPYAAAFGTEERNAVAHLKEILPTHRAVVLTEAALLEAMSDNPEKERADVKERVQSLLPDGWTLLDESELQDWLAPHSSQLTQVAEQRRSEVARFLMSDAAKRVSAHVEELTAQVAQTDTLLAREDAAIAQAQQKGDRIAGHILRSMRCHTEQMLIELRDFLLALEADLPDQVAAMTDTAAVRHALPHWLHHVIETWFTARLDAWRQDVLADLEDLQLADGEADATGLLPPALYPASVRDDSGWTHRMALTAAVGGGAALMLIGMWIPAALAMGTGLVWSAAGKSSRELDTRERMVDRAKAALRHLGRDAERLLGDQLDQIATGLESLGSDRATSAEAERATLRQELNNTINWQRAKLAQKRRIGDDLQTQMLEFPG